MEPGSQKPEYQTAESKDPDAVVEDNAETESAPAAEAGQAEVPPSGSATAVEAEEAHEFEVASDQAIALEFLNALVDKNTGQVDAELKDMADIALEILKEKYGEEAISQEKMDGLKTLVSEFAGMISEKDGSTLNAHPEIRKKILYALCEPIINTELSAEEVTSYVKHIVLKPRAEVGEAQAEDSGYEGVFFYNSKTQTIEIIEEAVTSDGTIDGVSLDFNHLISHEMSHGISEDLIFDRMGEGQLKSEMNAENAEFSSDLMKATREILDAADELADSQTQHIRTVLKGLANVEQDYDALSDAGKQHYQTKENYIAERRVNAAREIVTDYTAVFAQCDGTLNSFANKCIDMSRGADFEKFLKTCFSPDADMDRDQIREKMRSVNESLENGSKSLDDIKSEYPGFAKLFGTYEVFFNNISKFMKDRAEIRKIIPESNEGEEDYEGGFYDGAGGFGNYDQKAPENKGTSGIWNEAKGLLGAFADEVNITSSIT